MPVQNPTQFPYKVYVAQITQNGVGNPVATVQFNTLGPISWLRLGAGLYDATLVASFIANKTTWFVNKTGDFDGSNPTYNLIESFFNDESSIRFETAHLEAGIITPADDVFFDTSVEIRVYP